MTIKQPFPKCTNSCLRSCRHCSPCRGRFRGIRLLQRHLDFVRAVVNSHIAIHGGRIIAIRKLAYRSLFRVRGNVHAQTLQTLRLEATPVHRTREPLAVLAMLARVHLEEFHAGALEVAPGQRTRVKLATRALVARNGVRELVLFQVVLGVRPETTFGFGVVAKVDARVLLGQARVVPARWPFHVLTTMAFEVRQCSAVRGAPVPVTKLSAA